jgi:hypothetical protein
MRGLPQLASLALLAILISGCTYIDRLTGSTDNTVLPGTREDAIPGKSQFPDASDAAPAIEQPATQQTVEDTTAKPACPEDQPDCAQSADGTFSDPQ